MSTKVTRRNLLRHAGVAAVFAPFLAMLEDKPAKAATGKAKYLLVIHSPGTEPGVWRPSGGDSVVFSKMNEPLAPIKSGVILVDGLNSFGSANNHGSPGGLTGMNHGAPIHISVEQFVSDGLKASGVVTQIPNLLLGGVPTEQLCTFFRAGKALAPIASPASAYQAVFGGGAPTVPTTPEMPGQPSAAEVRLRRRKSVLDVMKGEIKQLHDALGTHERVKLDSHLDSIKQLEARLAQAMDPGNPDGGGGMVVKPVDCARGNAPAAAPTPVENSVLHVQVAITAMACDITRVAAVQFGHHQSAQVNIPEVGAAGDWHNGFMHSDNPRTRLINVERWMCKQFVAAAEKLKATPAPDGQGTLWDQTLMVWARDMGDAVVHDGTNIPFVFGGGAGGYLRHSGNGRHIDGGGDHHMRALMNVIEGMGISNFTGFGDPAAGATARQPLPSLAAT